MESIPLKQAVAERRTTPLKVSKKCGVTKNAINKAIQAERNIYLLMDENNVVHDVYEVKRLTEVSA